MGLLPKARSTRSIAWACLHCGKKALVVPSEVARRFCDLTCRWAYARATRTSKTAICHPDRTRRWKGLCISCWRAQWTPDQGRRATCHPDRPHQGKGLCLPCYEAKRRAERDNQRLRLRYSFGISLERYDELFRRQNGLCAICGKNEQAIRSLKGSGLARGKKSLAVDHSHKTGLIRGLLCHRCNIGLGHLDENPVFLARAIAYLADHLGESGDLQIRRCRKHAYRVAVHSSGVPQLQRSQGIQ